MTHPSPAVVATSHTDIQFRDLVETHKRALYYLSLDLTGNHHDAEDLMQDVFIKAHKNLDRFRGESSMYTWLRRIAINAYLNKKRKKVHSLFQFFSDKDESFDAPSPSHGPEEQTAGAVTRAHIDRALNTLSPRERLAFVLRHHQDMSLAEVAASMDVADGTVKSLLFRATRKLQQQLAFLMEEPASPETIATS